MRIPGFCGGSCTELSTNVNAERTVNLYPHLVGGGTPQAQMVLYRVPGMALWSTLSGSSTRATYTNAGSTGNERLFAVAGTVFYEINNNGTATNRGAVQADTNPATICSNGTNGGQLFICSGSRGYIFTLATNTLTEIADVDFPQAQAVMGAFTDGYFVVLNETTGAFQFSGLFDGAAWNALDVALVSQVPDQVQALLTLDRQLWLFGRENTSIWYNSGDPDSPFQPTQSLIQHGIQAPWTAQRIDNTILWLGQSEGGGKVVYRAQGQSAPQRVSTHALEHIWQELGGTLDDAIAYTELFNGHPFYVLQPMTGTVTWVYDVSTNLWHERALWDTETGTYSPDLGRCHAYAFGKHLVGDRRSGAIYEEKASLYDVT
jgi:hypothetical protein